MNNKLILVVFALVMLSVNAMRLRSHEGPVAWAVFDESTTGGKCTDYNQCDGARTCNNGACTGVARPDKNSKYYYNESITQSKCPSSRTSAFWSTKDYFCDGDRYCSLAGWCQGTAR